MLVRREARADPDEQNERQDGGEVAVRLNGVRVQPPHLRYQPKVNSRHDTQAAKSVTATQSIRSGSGFGRPVRAEVPDDQDEAEQARSAR